MSGTGIASTQSIHTNIYATQPLAKFSTKAQLETTIPKIISSKYRIYFRVTKPNTKLNTLHLKTIAKQNSDRSYSITRQKI